MTGYTDEKFAHRGQGSLWISCYTFTEMSSCSVAQAGKSQSQVQGLLMCTTVPCLANIYF